MPNKQLKIVVLLILLLTSTTYVMSTLTDISKLLAVICVYAVLLAISLISRNTINDLGLSRSRIRYGIKLAIPFMLAMIAVAFFMMLINPSNFQDTRYQIGFGQLLLSLFIIIPLQTVLLEELIFRGFLLGTLADLFSWQKANILCAICFGLWHIFSAQSFNLAGSFSQPIIIIGIVIATTLAGLLFGWLRIKSGSLLAPIMVHWCINSVGVTVAFIAWNVPA